MTNTIDRFFGIKDPHRLSTSLLDNIWEASELPKKWEFISPKSLIGIEVEVENVLKIGPNIPSVWIIETDGSLRNN